MARTKITRHNIKSYILAYQLDDAATLEELTDMERNTLAQTLNEAEKGAIEKEPEYEGTDGGTWWNEWAIDTIYRHYIINLELLEELNEWQVALGIVRIREGNEWKSMERKDALKVFRERFWSADWKHNEWQWNEMQKNEVKGAYFEWNEAF